MQYRDVLDDLVLRLMDKETLSKDEVLEVFSPVHKRASRGSWTGTGRRRPSDRPPVLTKLELAVLGVQRVRDERLRAEPPASLAKEPATDRARVGRPATT